MRIVMLGLGLLLAASAPGCGGGRTAKVASNPASAPHGGVAVPLDQDRGYAEVLLDANGLATAGAVRVVAYFYGPDLTTPLTPDPTDVSVKLEFPDKDPEDVRLTPESQAVATSGATRFASRPGPFAVEPLAGELTVTIDGQTSTHPFAGGR